MVLKSVAAFGLILLVSACGGGGGGGSTGPVLLPDASPGSFNALVSREITLANRFYNADARLVPTAAGQMPQSGVVSYAGVAAFSRSNRPVNVSTTNGAAPVISLPAPDMAGRVALTADFATGSLSGTITGFRDAANTALPGTLTLGAAPITGSNFGTGTVTGRYPVNGTAQSVQGLGYSGTFTGDRAAGAGGLISFIAPAPAGGVETVNGTFLVGQ